MRVCVCGKPASPRGLWCSQACNAQHRRTSVERSCVACGARFYRRPGDSDSPKYCSTGCRIEHKRATGKNYPKRGKRALHRIVMEEKLGRPLTRGEVVHHVNHNKLDFSESNLELKPSQSAHMKEHWADGSISTTHEAAVARGKRSGEVRRARRTA